MDHSLSNTASQTRSESACEPLQNPVPLAFSRLESAVSSLFGCVDFIEQRIDAVLSPLSEEKSASGACRPSMGSELAEAIQQQADRAESIVERLNRLGCRVTL